MQKINVALIHDYLNQNGGAEKTLEALIELFPKAPVFTSTYAQEIFPHLSKTKIVTPKLEGLLRVLPIVSKYFTFLIPIIFEEFDLSHYDIIISDSSAYAKGVITNANQLHISYIHTPPRFMYKYSVESVVRNKWYYKPVVIFVDHYLRLWDYIAAQRADVTACNSNEIKRRVKKFYKINAEVIYPPVELPNLKEELASKNEILNENYFLIAGRLEIYKNFDKVIKAFNLLPDLNLVVIGTGKQEKYLKSIASKNITFAGRVSDKEKHNYMHNCLGLINAVQDEDFGIVPIEVQGHGRPVLAHRSAGHLETIAEDVTGVYFDNLESEDLRKKIMEFNTMIKDDKFDPETIRLKAQKFSKATFKTTFKKFVEKEWEKHNAGRTRS